MNDNFFSDVTTPQPPVDLRDKVLQIAASRFPLVVKPSFIDRCWNSRALWWSWCASVLVIGVLLLTWNPPIPEISSGESSKQASIEKELLEVDPTLISLYLPPVKHREERR